MSRKRWTQDEMLARLAEIVAEVGRGVRLRKFLDRGGVPESQMRRTFGTWETLRRQAGLTPADQDQRRVSDEQLWEEYARQFKLVKRTPSTGELERLGRFSARTYYVRFGSRKHIRQAFYNWLQERVVAADQAADVVPREVE
jgi:hypothetical protein